jgi:hypothetical protein
MTAFQRLSGGIIRLGAYPELGRRIKLSQHEGRGARRGAALEGGASRRRIRATVKAAPQAVPAPSFPIGE